MWEGKFLYSYRACIRRTPILRPLTHKSTNPSLLEEAVKTNIPASTRGNGDEDSACHASGMKPTSPVPWTQEEAACPVIPPACYQRFLQTSKHFKGKGSQSCPIESLETSQVMFSTQVPRSPGCLRSTSGFTPGPSDLPPST